MLLGLGLVVFLTLVSLAIYIIKFDPGLPVYNITNDSITGLTLGSSRDMLVYPILSVVIGIVNTVVALVSSKANRGLAYWVIFLTSLVIIYFIAMQVKVL